MKSLKVLVLALLTVATIGAAFAFTSSKKVLATQYFRFNSAVTYNATTLQDPNNWTVVASPLSNHNSQFVHEIAIINNPSNLYTYPAGTPLAGKPRVDGSNSALTSDVVTAFNAGPGTAVEVFQTDYQILTNQTR